MSSLEERVAALEARMAELEGARQPAAAPAVKPASAPPPMPKPAVKSLDTLVASGEGWLGRAGVTLLVVGLVLLFRYAVEQGWLTPAMRIGIGLLIGGGMLVGGTSLFPERRRYRQILMGGGLVVLFITGLAASELYQLISGTTALIFFIGVAATAFTLAARQQESIIASIGAVGALLPPSFLLADSVPGSLLWLYLTIIITWTGTLMALRGWQNPLLVAAAASILSMMRDQVPEQAAVQLAAYVAMAVCWICFAALPLLRAHSFAPQLVLALPTLITISLAFVASEFVLERSYTFELSATLGALGFAIIAWWLFRSGANAQSASLLDWRGESFRVNGYTAALAAALLSLSAAVLAGVPQPWYYAFVALIAGAAMLSAHDVEADLLRPLGHLLFALLGIAFVGAMQQFDRLPAFDDHALTFAIVTAVAGYIALRLPRADERLVYLCIVYFTSHTLLATELSDVQGAPWLASASYGLVGSTLLIAGLSRRMIALQRAGMLSLALLVGRLFLYDLDKADVGVRVVVFMVAGFAFLGLSYLVKSRRFNNAL